MYKVKGRHKAEALRGVISDYFGTAGLEDLAVRSGRLALLEVASCAGGTAAAWLGVWACVGKSTYARCGIIVNVTPFEPEWEGYVTIEISNTTPLPARIYAGEGIAQVLFFEGEAPEVSYADRNGKYQKQTGITLPRL